jgi:hypothetical protein
MNSQIIHWSIAAFLAMCGVSARAFVQAVNPASSP